MSSKTSQEVILRPYQWSVQLAVLKVLLYPAVLAALGSLIAIMSGNGGLTLLFLLALPLLALPVAAIVGTVVRLNRGTLVTADATRITKRGVWSTTSCLKNELEAIQYSSPLRGALECQFLRKDGRTAFRITVAPWTVLQHDLKGFAAAIDVPLRPNRWVRKFRL